MPHAFRFTTCEVAPSGRANECLHYTATLRAITQGHQSFMAWLSATAQAVHCAHFAMALFAWREGTTTFEIGKVPVHVGNLLATYKRIMVNDPPQVHTA